MGQGKFGVSEQGVRKLEVSFVTLDQDEIGGCKGSKVMKSLNMSLFNKTPKKWEEPVLESLNEDMIPCRRQQT